MNKYWEDGTERVEEARRVMNCEACIEAEPPDCEGPVFWVMTFPIGSTGRIGGDSVNRES